MSNNITDRIVEIIEYYKLNISSFEQKISASNGLISKSISRKSAIKSDICAKILEVCPEINAYWLITGRGSMLFSPKTEPEKQPADTELLPLMGGYKPKKEPEKQPAATSDLHLQAEIDKLKAICAEKERTISVLQERIDSQRHFLDILSESHRDLVDKTESIASVATDERH